MALLASGSAVAEVLHGPYVLLEDAQVLRIRFEVDRPDYEAVLLHGAGERTRVVPSYRRSTRDTFLADVPVDLSIHQSFRGYEIGRAGETAKSFAWRSRINGELQGYPRLLVFGDSQGGAETLAQLAERWAAEDFDAIVGLGDLADAGSRFESWREEFFEPLREVLPHRPFLAICGNHDSYRGKSLEWFDWYFGRSDGRRYFKIDFGDLRLIGLNNSDVHTKYGFDPIDPLTPQYDFLMASVLGATAAGRKLAVFSHVPMFSGSTVVNQEFGSELQRKYLLPIIERARVLGFFAGHHHKYERIERPGLHGPIQHVVTGGGGGRLFTAERERGGVPMDREIFEVYHYLTVDFSGAGTVVARAVDGAEIDRVSFTRGADPALPSAAPELWRADVSGELDVTPTMRIGHGLALEDRVPPAGGNSAKAQIFQTERGLVGMARNLAAANTDAISFQGYDWQRKAWGYLQGGSLVVPVAGHYGTLALVSINGADLSPLDRAVPVLHWPVAGGRAGVSEQAGAVMLLRGGRDFELDLDPSRLIAKWRWGDAPLDNLAPAQRSRQWSLIESAPASPTPQPLTQAELLRLVAGEGKPEGFLVRTVGGQTLAVMLHWPAWRFLALVTGESLVAGAGSFFMSTAAGAQVTSESGGLRVTLGGGITHFIPLAKISKELPGASEGPAAAGDFTLSREVLRSGFDGKTNWVHARAGVIPGPGPVGVMTMQKMRLDRSDFFFGIHSLASRDRGRTWSEPVPQSGLDRRSEGDVIVGISDFWPKWHAATGRLLGIGHTVRYQGDHLVPSATRRRETAYSVYDADRQAWAPWRILELPDEPRFHGAGAGCVQRFDLPDGTILLPFYFKPMGTDPYQTAVLRCDFDGDRLRVREIGEPIAVPVARGVYEPSLTRHRGRFFLTLRNDQAGYVTTSEDGLRYRPPVPWTFDDGSPLGNYNTQQHWVTHERGLHLVYTRRGADNDHVFRHRAPLFIARVDPERLCVIRATEQILVPNHGARLGNFGVTEVTPNETWITVTEWMQGPSPHQYDPEYTRRWGADNRVWLARLSWK